MHVKEKSRVLFTFMLKDTTEAQRGIIRPVHGPAGNANINGPFGLRGREGE